MCAFVKPTQIKYTDLNTEPSDKRRKMFLREIEKMKKKLNEYVAESYRILESCNTTVDTQQIKQVIGTIQNK